MIRKYEPRDLDQVMKIWLETNIAAHSFITEKYWTDNFEAVKKALPEAEVYIYECGRGCIGGFIGLNGGYIEGIFVRCNLQSGGIGKQLLDYVRSFKSELKLNVYFKNNRAVKFYEREGFTILSELFDESIGEKEYIMTWHR